MTSLNSLSSKQIQGIRKHENAFEIYIYFMKRKLAVKETFFEQQI